LNKKQVTADINSAYKLLGTTRDSANIDEMRLISAVAFVHSSPWPYNVFSACDLCIYFIWKYTNHLTGKRFANIVSGMCKLLNVFFRVNIVLITEISADRIDFYDSLKEDDSAHGAFFNILMQDICSNNLQHFEIGTPQAVMGIDQMLTLLTQYESMTNCLTTIMNKYVDF